MEKDIIKTGTTTVGIVCREGIVLAADKRATAGYLLVNRKEEKIIQISDNLAVTTAGIVSDVQLLVKIIKAQLKLAVKAVNAAIQRDIASGNGIDVVTVTSSGIKKVLEKEINTKITM